MTTKSTKAVLFCIMLLASANIMAQQLDANTAKALTKKHATEIGLTQADLLNSRVSDAYFDNTSGATLVYLQQTYKGIDVFNAIQTLAFKNDKLVASAGKRLGQVDAMANTKEAKASISAGDAVRAAATHLRLSASAVSTTARQINAQQFEFGNLGISSVNIKSKLIWLPEETTGAAILSWQVEIQPNGSPDYWLVNVDAKKGNVLSKINLNVSCDWSHPKNPYKVDNIPALDNTVTDDALSPLLVNSARFRVIPYPAESPIHAGGSPAIRQDPWNLSGTGSDAITLQWNSNGTITFDSTRGNNVLAQEDRNGNNGSGKGVVSRTPLTDLNFTAQPDFTRQPTTTQNQKFGITNLFYWNNIMHDISYQYGFDEPAGNFQDNNLRRGGIGHDYVFADAQDGAGSNNANFSTPPDGSNPRMQMFLFNLTSPNRDGDVDNGVISHEYTHGISNRLTGGPATTSCLDNKEQMGEGWSDYLALMVTTNWRTATVDDGPKRRPIGNYVLGYPTNGPGIRWYPYSTRLNVNPWTYDSMKLSDRFSNNIFLLDPHTVGEVWCNILWVMTWELIKQVGIRPNLFKANVNGGNNIALRLVITGMKLQGCSPGFVDGRNGILKADTMLYGGVHSKAIWRAFASRGLGVKASQGSSNNVKDGIADYTEPSSADIIAGNFSAVKQNEVALLHWQYPARERRSEFVIERSNDGQNFNKIGTVNATTSTDAYDFTDHLPARGINFYRLSSAVNGKTVYSDVRVVNFNSISLSPNPAKDKVTITVGGNIKLLKVTITNTTGQQLRSYNMNGEYLHATLPHVAPGLYYIKITGNGFSETRKLIIQ